MSCCANELNLWLYLEKKIKMKRIYILFIVFAIQFAQAQQQDLQRANRLFEKTYYSEAIPLYEKIILKNQSIML